MSAGVALPRAASPRASILIAAFGAERFERCVRSLADRLDEEPAVEVIAVLNGRDPRLRELAAATAGLRVIDPPANLGFPAGCNLARSVAIGDYLVLLQDDGRVLPGWLDALVRAGDSHPEAGLVGSVTLWPGGARIMQAGQVLFSDGGIVEVCADAPPESLDGRGPFAVDTLSSHGMLVRARTWDAVGGLDEDYFPLYMADLTLCARVRERGEAVLCAPGARAEHERGSSTRARFRSYLFDAHFDRWRAQWGDSLTQFVSPEPVADATERALARAESQWRAARPGPPAPERATPPYEPDGDPLRRLEAGIRFATLAAEVRERYADALEARIDQLEAQRAAVEPELVELRRRAQTLDAIQAGGWWRLRSRLLPLIGAARRFRERL